MNVQLANVISTSSARLGKDRARHYRGRTGRGRLAQMKNAHPGERGGPSLRGNWREEHLFALRQAMALYDAYGERLAECDQQLEALLAALQPEAAGDPGKNRRRSRAGMP